MVAPGQRECRHHREAAPTDAGRRLRRHEHRVAGIASETAIESPCTWRSTLRVSGDPACRMLFSISSDATSTTSSTNPPAGVRRRPARNSRTHPRAEWARCGCARSVSPARRRSGGAPIAATASRTERNVGTNRDTRGFSAACLSRTSRSCAYEATSRRPTGRSTTAPAWSWCSTTSAPGTMVPATMVPALATDGDAGWWRCRPLRAASSGLGTSRIAGTRGARSGGPCSGPRQTPWPVLIATRWTRTVRSRSSSTAVGRASRAPARTISRVRRCPWPRRRSGSASRTPRPSGSCGSPRTRGRR